MNTSQDRAREFSRLVAIHLAKEGTERRVTQREIAKAAGIGAEAFSYYVAGTRGSMAVGVLLRAAEHLGLDPQLIVTRAYEDLVRSMGEPAEPATPRSGSRTTPS